MRDLFMNSEGSFSVEAAIVLTALVIVFSTFLSFMLGFFSGIDSLCGQGISYTGILPVTIHRVTSVIFETGGELFAKIR